MKTRIILFLLLFAGIIQGADFEEIITKDIDLGNRKVLIVECTIGNVSLLTHDSKKIQIRAIKSAVLEEALKKTRIVFQEAKDLIKIFSKSEKPDLPVGINFQLTIPAELDNLKVICLNGKISAKGNFRNISFTTKTNNILFEGDFSQAVFLSVNGKLDIYCPEKLKGKIAAETENGEIRLELNPESEFSLEGTTLNGDIYTNYDFPVKDGLHSKTITGKINQGLHKIRLKSLNGVIKIYRF